MQAKFDFVQTAQVRSRDMFIFHPLFKWILFQKKAAQSLSAIFRFKHDHLSIS
jgi:hypothetical protein